MGFNSLFINPFHLTGASGSLYSIKNYNKIDPAFLSNGNIGWREFSDFVIKAKKNDLRIVIDLVINHTATDSDLIKLHPEWFKYDENNHLIHPFCIDPGNGGKVTIWKDLVEVDNAGRGRKNGLWLFWDRLIKKYMDMGIGGFRCDAAYKVITGLWEYLIQRAKKRNKEVLFLAETLGCSEEETIRTAQCGFDYIYNSSKWWDLSSDWCLRQNEVARQYADSISFPETHDTVRLSFECHGNRELCKMRYLFASLFSKGVMMPIGYEYGFQKSLHVVKTVPRDWEDKSFDLVDFIAQCNALKDRYKIFNEEGEQYLSPLSKPSVLVLKKFSPGNQEKAAIIVNKTPDKQRIFIASPKRFLNTNKKVEDISICNASKNVPEPLKIELSAYQVKILYADS